MPSPAATQPSTPCANDLARFAYPWSPDLGDGTFQNPVLYADYSDPDAIRVGKDYFLTASSFTATPGLPILHSRDLVNWTLINHALKNLPHPRYECFQAGCGVWAPALRHHAGKFWIFFPMPDEGIYVTTATHPAAAWEEPWLLQAGKGLIDPCPLWDDDGSAYLVHAYAGSRAGIKHRLRVCPMAPDARQLLGEGQIVFHEPDQHPTLEGPKFYKRNGWYYLLAPAGGVENGWQVALRSKKIYGPYEDKIVLAQGGTPVNGPHQGALLDSADGKWWFLHFQDAGLHGRITHLQPVQWENDWPIIGARGEPVARHIKPQLAEPQTVCAPQTSDEFADTELGRQWQWNANHQAEWYSLTVRPGWLRLYSQPAADPINALPNLLSQKFPARSFLVETLLDPAALPLGGEAGLAIAGRSYAALYVRRAEGQNELRLRRDQTDGVVRAAVTGELCLRVRVDENGQCEFSFSSHDEFIPVPEAFTATAGVWVGAKAGLFARHQPMAGAGGHADFDYFRFQSPSPRH
jgi:beta-xylosidase